MTRFKQIVISAIATLTGLSCNVAVRQLNGGMPANLDYAVPSKRAYDILNMPYPKHTSLYDGTQLKFLADILPFSFSVGDVLMLGGLAAMVIIVTISMFGIMKGGRIKKISGDRSTVLKKQHWRPRVYSKKKIEWPFHIN
jgi:hypothetical protein